jgi:hypothetical protein
VSLAREHTGEIAKAMDDLRKLTPDPASHVSEGNFFDSAWQRSYWGPNYPRLSAREEEI